MRKSSDIHLLVISLLAFIMIAGGVSYAYFVYNKEIATADLTSGEISISFSNQSNTINNNISQPINDDNGKILPYYVDFTVTGVTDSESVYYEVYLVPNNGNVINGKYVSAYLTNQSENSVYGVNGVSSLASLPPSKVNNGIKLYSGIFEASSNGTRTNHSADFRLRMWMNDKNNNVVSQVSGYSIYLYAENTEKVNFMGGFPAEITNLKTSIKEVYFKNDAQSVIDSKCSDAANNGGVCQNITYQNRGTVKAWLEPIENNMYTMYVESDGETYFSIASTQLFSGYTGLTNIQFENVNTSNVTSFDKYFYDCSSLRTLNLQSFNVNNGINFWAVFQNCANLESVNMNGWFTGLANNYSYMFDGCSSLVSVDLSGFNTSSNANISFMFKNCAALTSIDLSEINLSGITDTSQMFYNCSHLTSLKIGSINFASGANLYAMFAGCEALTELDLSAFSASGTISPNSMFASCTSLHKIYVDSSWDTVTYTNSNNMFEQCTSLEGGSTTSFDLSYPTDASYAHIDGGLTNPGYFTDIADKPVV